MKTLFALLILFATPLLAGPPGTGGFWNPESEIAEGVNVVTSPSGKLSFIIYTTHWECDDKETVSCWSRQGVYSSDLNPVVEGQVKCDMSTSLDGVVYIVGECTLNITDTGYHILIKPVLGTPLEVDNRIYDVKGMDFNTCYVSPDPMCGVVPE